MRNPQPRSRLDASRSYALARRSAVQSGVFICRDGTQEPWRLRVSTKARMARVSFSTSKGLEVVLPQGSWLDPNELLERSRLWVERTLAKNRVNRARFQTGADALLPTVLDLPGIGMCCPVEYREVADATSIRATFREGSYRLVGSVRDEKLCGKRLQSFVVRMAKDVLPRLLAQDAAELGVTYAGCRVSNAHTRWGSCSVDGRIMLSAQLAFLPPHLVFHTIAHELAHVRYHDHQAKFHAELLRFDPQARVHAKELRAAAVRVPAWMR